MHVVISSISTPSKSLLAVPSTLALHMHKGACTLLLLLQLMLVPCYLFRYHAGLEVGALAVAVALIANNDDAGVDTGDRDGG